MQMDLFGDTAAILNSIVSNSYIMGFLVIRTNLPPKHPIIAAWNSTIQNGRPIAEKVHSPNIFPSIVWNHMLSARYFCLHASLILYSSFEVKLFDIRKFFEKEETTV